MVLFPRDGFPRRPRSKIMGFARRVEVTWGPKGFGVHAHMLVFYYDVGKPTVERFQEGWRRALALDYVPHVDIQFLEGTGDGLAREAAGRYAYMHKGYHSSSSEDTRQLLTISEALKGQLRVSKGGDELRAAFRDSDAAYKAKASLASTQRKQRDILLGYSYARSVPVPSLSGDVDSTLGAGLPPEVLEGLAKEV